MDPLRTWPTVHKYGTRRSSQPGFRSSTARGPRRPQLRAVRCGLLKDAHTLEAAMQIAEVLGDVRAAVGTAGSAARITRRAVVRGHDGIALEVIGPHGDLLG